MRRQTELVRRVHDPESIAVAMPAAVATAKQRATARNNARVAVAPWLRVL